MLDRLLRPHIVLLFIESRAYSQPGLWIIGINLGSILKGPLSLVPVLSLHVSEAEHDVSVLIPRVQFDRLFETIDCPVDVALLEEVVLAFNFSFFGGFGIALLLGEPILGRFRRAGILVLGNRQRRAAKQQ